MVLSLGAGQCLPILAADVAAGSNADSDLCAAAKPRPHSINSSTQGASSHSRNGDGISAHQPSNYSALMFAARITLAHFSVSSAMNLPRR